MGVRLTVLGAALFTLLSILAPAAYAANGESEVRITAQRLADGHTEFALQQHRADGEWGERQLPRARFFPADIAAGRWLVSSVLTITVESDSMSTGTADPGREVRIAAQRLPDGRIEFALQQRQADGEWGERQLPRARVFPADIAAGRWLVSSPLTVSTAEPELTATPTPATTCALADNVESVMAATFQVLTATVRGTAFYIGNGEWITNHHVVENATAAFLVHADDRISAVVTGSLPAYDLALLRAQPPASVGALGFVSARPTVGSSVSVAGFPRVVISTPSLSRGIVSKHAPSSQWDHLGDDGVVLQTDAAINQGNSGGPIVDDCGAVVAVATFKVVSTSDDRGVEGLGFGIAAETVRAQLRSLRSSTHQVSTAPTTPETLEIGGFCNAAAGDTLDNCRAAAVDGLDPDQPPYIWARGVDDWSRVACSIDGDAAVWWADLTLRALADGRHTIRVIERQEAGWTEWSAPYTFTIRKAPASDTPPSTPTGVSVTKDDIRGARDDLLVTWNPMEGATFYEIHHRTTVSNFAPESRTASASYRDTDPSLWFIDSYVVRACNAAGCSDYSAIAQEVP